MALVESHIRQDIMRRVHSKHGQCSTQGTGACGQWGTLPLFSPWNMTFRFVEEIDNPSFFGVQKIAKECWCQFLGCVVIKDLGRREVQMWYDVVLKGAGAKQTRIEGVNKNVVFELPRGFHQPKWCTAGDWSVETASDTVFFEGILKCWSMRSIYYRIWFFEGPTKITSVLSFLVFVWDHPDSSWACCPTPMTSMVEPEITTIHQWLFALLAGFYWIQCTLNVPKFRHWMIIVSLCFLFTRAIWYTVYMGMWCTPC